MKIVALEARTEAIPLARPYTITFRTVTAIETVVVRVHDGAGRTGWGAASPERHVTGETDAACQAALAPGALDWLVGRDTRTLPAIARDLERAMPTTPAARAAVDMALHDLLAQRLDLPLVDLLGRAHDALATSVTIGIKPTDEALAEVDEHLGHGFRVLKIKIGRALDEDLERLARIRERAGPHVRLRADANQGYTLEQTRRFFAATAPLDLEFVEQPVAAADTDALRTLPPELRARIAIDEPLLGPREALAFAAPPQPGGIYNIKLMKCGGVTAALRIATIAETAGIGLMWGCMDESRIGIAAALHAALACPATRHLDLDGSFDLARDVVAGGFVVEPGGILRTTGAPGLGLSPGHE